MIPGKQRITGIPFPGSNQITVAKTEISREKELISREETHENEKEDDTADKLEQRPGGIVERRAEATIQSTWRRRCRRQLRRTKKRAQTIIRASSGRHLPSPPLPHQPSVHVPHAQVRAHVHRTIPSRLPCPCSCPCLPCGNRASSLPLRHCVHFHYLHFRSQIQVHWHIQVRRRGLLLHCQSCPYAAEVAER